MRSRVVRLVVFWVCVVLMAWWVSVVVAWAAGHRIVLKASAQEPTNTPIVWDEVVEPLETISAKLDVLPTLEARLSVIEYDVMSLESLTGTVGLLLEASEWLSRAVDVASVGLEAMIHIGYGDILLIAVLVVLLGGVLGLVFLR